MKLTSTLESVIVYRSGAVCMRRAPLAAGGDTACVEVCGLPLSLVVGTVRAGIVGDDAITVVDVRPGFDVAIATPADLSEEARTLAEAEQRCGTLSLQIDRLERELAELRALVPRFREPEPDSPPRVADLAAMLALSEFVDGRLATVAARRRELAIELADARERQRTAAARLREASTATRTSLTKVSRSAIVTLSGPPTRDCGVTIEYEVPGARWAPTYQLAIGDGGVARLGMRAAIAQQTGEDWTAVSLVLSTASRCRDATIPELRSLRVGRSQAEPPRAGWREPPPGLDALFADFDAARARLVPPRSSATGEGNAPRQRLAPPRPPAAPPPPSMSPAAPLAMPAPRPMSAPMPAAPAAMAPPQAAMRRSAPEVARASVALGSAAPGGGGAFGGAPPADLLEAEEAGADSTGAHWMAPAPAGPSSQQLDYPSQRMQGPVGPSRGRLLPTSLDLVAIGVHVDVSIVVAALSTAAHTAEGVGHLPLPPDCVPVGTTAGFDYRFEARAPADVPSTGTWATVAVMDCDVAVASRFVTVPSVDPAVYRTIELTNRSMHALLPGPVDVSSGGKFLVTTTLGAIAPGATGRRIGLGVEEAIRIARNTRYAETTSGLFGGTSVLQHEIEIDIDNRLGVEVELDVRERVPVVDASEKDVKVEDGAVDPPWVAIDEPEDGELVHGLRRWRVRVAGRTKTKLRGGYVVRLPGDRMLVGGNRRG